MPNSVIPKFYSAADTNVVLSINTTLYQVNRAAALALSSAGYWITPTLNRFEDPEADGTIKQVFFSYISEGAASGSIVVKVSGDGGDTWAETETHTVEDTNGGIKSVSYGFNTSGTDLRIYFGIETLMALRLIGWRVRIVERGNAS